ncbi:MAG: GNAT family N-acetyltransferase [Chloroflexi bacterium]|nr:GNAT family N-acetyltransferase [Chloroflexota bacterium]
MSVRISGHKIVLRDMQLGDVAAYSHWMQPGHEWQRLDGPYYGHPSAEQVAQQVERVRARIERAEWPDPRERLMIAAQPDDAFIGMVTWYWISEETHWPAVGILIYDPARWRQGLGYEALGLWSDYLFRVMPRFARLDLRTWSGNYGMMGLALKLGYMEEARFRRARIVDGNYYDGLGYGVLRDEWAARYPDGFAAHLDHLNGAG